MCTGTHLLPRYSTNVISWARFHEKCGKGAGKLNFDIMGCDTSIGENFPRDEVNLLK